MIAVAPAAAVTGGSGSGQRWSHCSPGKLRWPRPVQCCCCLVLANSVAVILLALYRCRMPSTAEDTT